MILHELVDATLANERRIFPVGPYSWATVQVAIKSGGSANGATYTVKRSIDGRNFYAFPVPVTINGSGISAPIDVRGTAFVEVKVSAADATSPAMVEVSIYCENGNGAR